LDKINKDLDGEKYVTKGIFPLMPEFRKEILS
jgi:hypothetical protein